MALTPRSVYRYFVTDGVPSSGKYKPEKAEIIQLLEQLFGVSRGGWVVAQTVADLNAATGVSETDGGVVLTGAGAGYYSRDGGAWVFGRGFPDTFARLVDVFGTNTVSASVLAGVNPGAVLAFLFEPVADNTGPMTLNVSGQGPRALNAFDGAPLGSGFVQAGRPVLIYDNGDNTYRLMIDHRWQGLAEQAIQARDQAEFYRDQAAGLVSDAVAASEVPIRDSLDVAALEPVKDGIAKLIVLGEDGGEARSTPPYVGAPVWFSSPAGDGATARSWYRANENRDFQYLAWFNKKRCALVNDKVMQKVTGQTLSIVCVGDSMTYGHDTSSSDRVDAVLPHTASRAAVTYPARLQSRLNALLQTTVTVENRGFSGDTAFECYERWTTPSTANLALIMLGINDANGAGPGASFEQYCRYMELLVRRYLMWGAAVVIVTPTALVMSNTNHDSARYGQYARTLGEAYGCPVFEGVEPNLYALQSEVYSDSTHFNSVGYAKFGDAIASFIMAGSLARPVRKVASETVLGPGRSTEGIGAHVKVGALSTATTSYATSGAVATLTAATGLMSFSFYLDAEAAEVAIAGQVNGGCQVGLCDPYGGSGLNRVPLKSLSGRNIQETGPYVATNNSSRRNDLIQLGVLVGRGWKTITIAAGAAFASYVNALVVRPIGFEVAVADGDRYVPAELETFILDFPKQAKGSVSNPGQMAMPEYVMIPMPKGGNNWAGAQEHYHWPTMVKVRVRGTGNGSGLPTKGVTETWIVKEGTGASAYTLYSAFKSHANAMAPISVDVGWAATKDTPVELADLTIGAYPTGGNVTRWLVLRFPVQDAAFHTIEVECLARRGYPYTALN